MYIYISVWAVKIGPSQPKTKLNARHDRVQGLPVWPHHSQSTGGFGSGTGQSLESAEGRHCPEREKWRISIPAKATVDGRNPAPVEGWFIPLFMWFQPSKVVQDFFHQAISNQEIHENPLAEADYIRIFSRTSEWKCSHVSDQQGYSVSPRMCGDLRFQNLRRLLKIGHRILET